MRCATDCHAVPTATLARGLRVCATETLRSAQDDIAGIGARPRTSAVLWSWPGRRWTTHERHQQPCHDERKAKCPQAHRDGCPWTTRVAMHEILRSAQDDIAGVGRVRGCRPFCGGGLAVIRSQSHATTTAAIPCNHTPRGFPQVRVEPTTPPQPSMVVYPPLTRWEAGRDHTLAAADWPSRRHYGSDIGPC